MHRIRCFSMAAIVLVWAVSPAISEPPENVILFVGDGMGPTQVKAANYYFHGGPGGFNFQSFAHRGAMTHNNSRDQTTDSAASATAMATGFKVANGVISRAICPGDHPPQPDSENGRDLPTLLERFQEAGKSTGLVTTSYMTDATPAAFGAHADKRKQSRRIAEAYFNHTRPNVLFGGGAEGFTAAAAEAADYQVVTNRRELENVDGSSVRHLAGVFGEGLFASTYAQKQGETDFYQSQPRLDEMTARAIEMLKSDRQGFFLLVENEVTDASGHANQIKPNVFAVRALAEAVQSALDMTAEQNTLIIVTADHETGGLAIEQAHGKGRFPEVTWSTGGHTQTPVPFYAKGPNAGLVADTLDNTDIPRIATEP